MRKLGLIAAVLAAVGGGLSAPAAAAEACEAPVVSIGDAVPAYEGTFPGHTAFLFPVTVTVAPGCPGPVGTATFATAFGSAGSADLVAAQGSLTWSGSTEVQHVVVQVVADSVGETVESFGVGLWHPRGVVIGRAQASTTILDDDHPPLTVNLDGGKICWREPVVASSSTIICPIPVKLSAPAAAPVTVRYRTIQVGTDPLGYVPVREASLTIRKGATVGYIPLTVLQDGRSTEERVIVEVFWTSAGKIANGRTEVRILPGAPA